MFDNSIKIFKSLSDNSRLRIVNNLLNGPMYVELLSERLNLSPSTVSFHLKKLEGAGLVFPKKEQYYVVYHLNEEILNKNLLSLVKIKDEEREKQDRRQEEYRGKIIKNFFEYGKLKSIPVQRKKRLVIISEISKAFEFGKEYTEKEVNLIISKFHGDFCTIRREFISEKLFTRENNIYIKVKEL
ncbi:metalloregulator ArsR/SmtB family transcription factor [Mycoplasmatota bacterium]|nr:metalloregulator ArsR/SmtB family transcription factor [Mycoplasmatota bacterium]